MAQLPQAEAPQDSRYDRRLSEILDCAAEIFATKGYEGASIRDLSRATGISLAGLYYYFDSKEKLLYSIQKHTFDTILARLRERLAVSNDPEERLRIFVMNHVEYAVARPNAMKVLAHEDDVLKNGYGDELAAIKREYYRECVNLVQALTGGDLTKRTERNVARRDVRTAVMALFGMLNWLHTWYNPQVDADAETLAGQLSDLFLQGLGARAKPATRAQRRTNLAVSG